MLQGLTTVSLPQIYCRSCHLSTRSDVLRCLHCNRPLGTAPVRKSRVMAHPRVRATSPLLGLPDGPPTKRARKSAHS